MFFLFFLFNFITLNFLLSTAVSAHCPLCVAGAGIGLSLARVLGVDDSITGVWLAAFLGATSFYLSTFPMRKIKFPFKKPTIYLLVFYSTLWSFYQFKLIDLHAGDIFGLPKLTFGMLSGSVLFYLVDVIDAYLIKRHGGVFFPYQRVVASLGSMLYLSIFNYFLINYII
jgi:hypothetical protein